ncbi:MAG: exosortase/archaeosortase family protein [Candidatus Methanoperedens sp.]|nr:exosortase/archaeosortase family protein [Candidatus Methanoperedens sp.]
MKFNTNTAYILSASLFVVGLVGTLAWTKGGKLYGFSFLLVSIAIGYYAYRKAHENIPKGDLIDIKQAGMGALIILIDVSYNLIKNDAFRGFDYGMILSGIFIILLNVGALAFLKFDRKMVTFISFFIFIVILLYGFFFKGIEIIVGGSGDKNPMWNWFGFQTVYLSSLVLNLVKPATAIANTIDFNGFRATVGYASSGIESISAFFAALIAYFVAKKERNFKKMGLYMLIGGAILMTMNILRVTILMMVGYFYGIPAFDFFHAYLGTTFFVVGMVVFWHYLFKNF